MRYLHTAWFFAAWLTAATAWAQSPPPEPPSSPDPRAAQLFEEARALAREGRHAEACARFTASFELDRATGTKLNLGDCHEQLGQLREAWQWFDEAARDFDQAGDKRAKFARERADALELRLVKVVVKLVDPGIAGLAVTIGGRNVANASEIRERVEPGTVEVRASAPGRTTFVHSEAVAAGATLMVEIPHLDAPGGDTSNGASSSGRGRRRLAYAVGGVGAVGLVATSVLVLVSRSKYRGAISDGHCVEMPDRLVCDQQGLTSTNDAIALSNVATWTGIASVALVAAAAVVYVTAPSDSVVVAPTAGGGAVGVALGGRF